jgi:hypothetical protein
VETTPPHPTPSQRIQSFPSSLAVAAPVAAVAAPAAAAPDPAACGSIDPALNQKPSPCGVKEAKEFYDYGVKSGYNVTLAKVIEKSENTQ